MIKKGLKVRVLTGKDKKKEGEVIEIDRSKNRVKVKEINSNVIFFEGGFSDYEENRQKRLGDISPQRIKYRKLKRK